MWGKASPHALKGQKLLGGCHKSHPIRPERAEAPSPGHRPGLGASALSGRAGIELLLGSEVEEEHTEQDEEEIYELRLEVLLVEDGCAEEEADDD